MNEERNHKTANLKSQAEVSNLQTTQRHPFMLPDEHDENSEDEHTNFENTYSMVMRKI